MMINYNIFGKICSFIPITAGKVIAWNTAGEAAKTAVDGNWFKSLIERRWKENLQLSIVATGTAYFSWWSCWQ